MAHAPTRDGFNPAFAVSSPLIDADGKRSHKPIKISSCWGRISPSSKGTSYQRAPRITAHCLKQYLRTTKRKFHILNIHQWVGKPHAIAFMHVNDGNYLAADFTYRPRKDESEWRMGATTERQDIARDAKSPMAATALLLDAAPPQSSVTILVNGISGLSLIKQARRRFFGHYQRTKRIQFEIIFALNDGYSSPFTVDEVCRDDNTIVDRAGIYLLWTRIELYERLKTRYGSSKGRNVRQYKSILDILK